MAWYRPYTGILVRKFVVFSRLYCCYDNLLLNKNDNNMFTTDWAVDTMIVASSDKEWI